MYNVQSHWHDQPRPRFKEVLGNQRIRGTARESSTAYEMLHQRGYIIVRDTTVILVRAASLHVQAITMKGSTHIPEYSSEMTRHTSLPIHRQRRRRPD